MNPITLGMAIVAVALMVLAVLFMNSGDFGVAGVLFLLASMTIYVRERWV